MINDSNLESEWSDQGSRFGILRVASILARQIALHASLDGGINDFDLLEHAGCTQSRHHSILTLESFHQVVFGVVRLEYFDVLGVLRGGFRTSEN